MTINKKNPYNGQSINNSSINKKQMIAILIVAGAIAVGTYMISKVADMLITTTEERIEETVYMEDAYSSFADQLADLGGQIPSESLYDELEVVGKATQLISQYEQAKDENNEEALAILRNKIVDNFDDVERAALSIAKTPFDEGTEIRLFPDGYRFLTSTKENFSPEGTSKDLVGAIVALQECKRNDGSGKENYKVYYKESSNFDEVYGYYVNLVNAAKVDAIAEHSIEQGSFGSKTVAGTFIERTSSKGTR